MFCKTCESTFREVFNNKPNYSPKLNLRILHHTPITFYESILIGCYVCRKTWVFWLKSRAAGTSYLKCASEGDMPKSYEDFRDQVRLLEGWRLHPTFTNPNDNQPKTEPYVTFNLHYLRYNQVSLLVKMDTSWVGFELQPRVIPETRSSTGSPNKVQCQSTAVRPDLWRHWLHSCLTSHTKCRALERKQGSFIPDRLIQILKDDDGNDTKWRLVERHRGDIDTSISYLTLSHCWGSSKHIKLTEEKHSAFREASNTSSLLKTYQDAFQIATSMGFRFIWIDSLCIIQDQEDQSDWKVQSSMMGSIYGSASCNIAATWAVDGTHGCFSLRDSYMIDPTTLRARIEHQVVELFGSQPLVDWHLDYTRHYHEDVEGAPLNNRAWVLQERYLATRQLNFSRRQVYWECMELMASEQYPNGCPEVTRVPRQKPSVDFEVGEYLLDTWNTLVSTYSTNSLTRKSDKLIAITGIASKFGEALADEYLAGMWRRNIHRQLCWRTGSADVLGPAFENRARLSPDIAPTWSWASMDGPVNMTGSVISSVSNLNIPLIQIIEAPKDMYITPKSHSFTAPALVIKGVGAWVRLEKIVYDGRNMYHLRECEFQANDQSEPIESSAVTGTMIDVLWDENVSSREIDPDRWDELKEQRDGLLFTLWVTYYGDLMTGGSEGLMLRMIPSSKGENLFVRMGAFSTPKGSQRLGEYLATRLRSSMSRPTRNITGIRAGYGNEDPDGLLSNIDVDLNDARLADLVHTVTII